MPAVPKHRKPIIDAAVTLFRRQGYSSTGLNEIVHASGAPKGSLYYYFPKGKTSIAVAAIEEAGERVARTVEDLSEKAPTTAELVREHARLLASWMKASRFRDGCPITTVLLELAPGDRAVAEAGRKAYAARLAVIRRKLELDGHSPSAAERLAILSVSALQGALIQSRVERSGRPIEVAADELGQLLEVTHPVSDKSERTSSKDTR